MTARQKKLARRRRVERRRKINMVLAGLTAITKGIVAFLATAVFMVVLVAHVEADPMRTILLLEVSAGFAFAMWVVWELFIKGKEENR